MNKNIKFLIYFFLLTTFTSCSFDKFTGIWDGSKKERLRIGEIAKNQKDKISSLKIFSTNNSNLEEIVTKKIIKLSKPKQNYSWIMSGLNLQNFHGHIYLDGIDNNFLKKKIGKSKFNLASVTSSPLVIDENIIFSDDTGSIFNINKNGKLIWKKNIYLKRYKHIYKNLVFSVYKDKIYVADNIGFIYSLNIDNGELIWIRDHGIPLKSNLKIYKNKLFVVNQDNRLLCLNIKQGSKIWDIRTMPSFIKSQTFINLAVSKNDEVLMINSAGDLFKVNANNGNIYWNLNTTVSMFEHDSDFFEASDVVIADKDIILSNSSYTFSFNLENGYLNWQQNIGSRNTPIINGNNVFLLTNDGYFINFNKLNGEIIWATNILKVLKKKKQMTNISGFILGSGKIYVTTINGHLIVCSATSGKVEYFKKIANTITSAPIISDNSLYILTGNSKILGFK